MYYKNFLLNLPIIILIGSLKIYSIMLHSIILFLINSIIFLYFIYKYKRIFHNYLYYIKLLLLKKNINININITK